MNTARELALQLATNQAVAQQAEPHETTIARAQAFLDFLTNQTDSEPHQP